MKQVCPILKTQNKMKQTKKQQENDNNLSILLTHLYAIAGLIIIAFNGRFITILACCFMAFLNLIIYFLINKEELI